MTNEVWGTSGRLCVEPLIFTIHTRLLIDRAAPESLDTFSTASEYTHTHSREGGVFVDRESGRWGLGSERRGSLRKYISAKSKMQHLYP